MNIMNIFGLLSFLCLMCLLGFFFDSIIGYLCKNEMGKYKAGISRLPLFFILGGGLYTFYEMFFSVLGAEAGITHFIILFIALLAWYSILRARNKTIPGNQPAISPVPALTTGTAMAMVVLIILPLSLNMITAMAFPQFDIDMLGHILIKAKILISQTYESSVMMHDNMAVGLQQRYPPFAGLFFNLLFLFGGQSISFYQLVNYFIFLLLGIEVYSFLRVRIPAWQALAWFFIFISTASYYSHAQHMLSSIDVLFSLAVLLAVSLLIDFTHKRDLYSLVMGSVLAGIASLIKNEGLFLGIILPFFYLPIAKRRFLLYIFIYGLIALPWVIYAQFFLPPSYAGTIDAARAFEILGNFRYIKTSLAVASGILLKEWNAFFVLWIFSIAVLLRTRHIKECSIFSVIIASSISAYFLLIWIIFPSISGVLVPDPVGYIRFISQAYPLALLCIALATARFMQKV